MNRESYLPFNIVKKNTYHLISNSVFFFLIRGLCRLLYWLADELLFGFIHYLFILHS